MLLAAAAIVFLVQRRQLLPLLLLGTGAAIVLLLRDVSPFSLFLARLQEFGNPLSSGSMRFFAPYWFVHDVMGGNTSALLFGFGPGRIGELGLSLDYAMLDLSWLKLFAEYGLLGAVPFLGFYVYALFRRSPDHLLSWVCFLQFLFLGGYLNAFYVQFLHMALVAWPKIADAADDSPAARSFGSPAFWRRAHDPGRKPMSIAAFFAGLAVLAALPALWPFGPYQLSLLLARRLRRFPPAPDPAHVEPAEDIFAICLCVYNEAAVIREKVEDLLRLREAADGALEIAIYVDAASDGTAEILASYRDRIKLVVSPERRGKTHGMNLLVAGTTASIVMFTDANVRIDPSAVTVLRRYFSDSTIGCVCSDLTYVNAGESAVAAVGSTFWSFNEWSKGLETATGSVIGADGSLFAICRRYHRPVPKGLFDDIYVSLCVLLAGARVVRAPDLKAYETHSTRASDEFRRKIRIACECMAVHFELWPELRSPGCLEPLQVSRPPADALGGRLRVACLGHLPLYSNGGRVRPPPRNPCDGARGSFLCRRAAPRPAACCRLLEHPLGLRGQRDSERGRRFVAKGW